MNEKFDVIIIGAGVVGVSSAIHLQQKGQSVLLLDKKGIAQGASYGNSGIIETSYVLPFSPPPIMQIPRIIIGKNKSAMLNYPSGLKTLPWILGFYLESSRSRKIKNGLLMRPLVENAIKEHEHLLKDTDGMKYITPHGRVKLHRSEKSFQNASLEREIAKEYGVPFDIYDAQTFHEIEPGLNPIYHKAVSWSGSQRYLNPGRAVACMADKFQSNGGIFKVEQVGSIASVDNGQWSVSTDMGVYEAKDIVICAGARTNKVLKPLGEHIPLGIKRGYHQHFTSPVNIAHAIVDADIGYVLSPVEQGMRIATGAEFAALSAPPNPRQITQVLKDAKELLPLDHAVEEKPWMGERPCTPDSLPIISPSLKHKGIWLNVGHGHCGITAGPASGRLLAEMMMHEKTFCDPAPYSANRFK